MTTPNDEYASWRTSPDEMRLLAQHFLWREVLNSNIHPSIDMREKQELRIAEIAAGSCLWAMQVAEEFPHAQVEASDISLKLIPPKSVLPPNLTVSHWNIFDPVPEMWQESFDLVHVRLLIQPFAGGQDVRPVLKKLVSMLSMYLLTGTSPY
jgi:hypothetical protein